jgi:hypothetical protein
MDAVSATIVDGGQAIYKITQEAIELSKLRGYFNN